MDTDFWSGFRLVVRGLVDAAQKATYSAALGGILFAATWVLATHVQILAGTAGVVLSISAFLLGARLGRAFDDRAERKKKEEQSAQGESPYPRLVRELERLREQEFELMMRMRHAGPDDSPTLERQLAVLRHREWELEQLRMDVGKKLDALHDKALEKLEARVQFTDSDRKDSDGQAHGIAPTEGAKASPPNSQSPSDGPAPKPPENKKKQRIASPRVENHHKKANGKPSDPRSEDDHGSEDADAEHEQQRAQS